MKSYTTILALILALKIIYTDSSQECPKENYIIIDKNGDKIECLPCAPCVVGHGLTPSCGSKLTEAQKAIIKCLPCEPGKTYSDKHGPSSCKSCQICPVTLKNCTTESNTQCSKDCGRGYYYDNATYNCQQCSYCCRKDNKRIAECAGLSAQSQCSVHDALECSPKTTKNPRPSSTNDGSTGDDEGIKTVVIAIVVVVAVVIVAVVVVVVVNWLLKRRKQRRDAERPAEQVAFRNGPNNCGIIKSSFFVMVNPPITPGNKAQEGKVLALICNNQGSPQDDNCFDNCNYIYDWKKDMMDYPCHGQNIDLNPVQVRDFGIYTCQVKCRKHPRQKPADAIELDLDVDPEPTKRYKNFTEINSLEIDDTIADMLKSPAIGIGDWKRVAEKYGMVQLKIHSLQDNEQRGMEVIKYLWASQTKLTVYDFCKFMKTIKQNQIVELLENHLTCENKETRRVDVRDSGYGHDFNGAQSSSSLAVLGAQNNPGLNDSLQGSRVELAANSHHGKKNPDKSNRKLDRQISNQSARSSGSAGSGSASNSLMRAARGLVRQISENSSYKKHENEDGHPT